MKLINRIVAAIAALLLGLSLAPAAHADSGSIAPPVIAFGDSITNGGGTANPDRYNWPTLMGAENTGIPGGCLVTRCNDKRPGISLYREAVLAQKPGVVIVAYGINDLVHSGPHKIVGGLKDIKRMNDARGIETYVATLTPVSGRFTGLDSYRVAVNDRIRAVFPEWRIIDFNAALASPTGGLPPRFDSGDHLHPNAAAYKRMAKVADRVINAPR